MLYNFDIIIYLLTYNHELGNNLKAYGAGLLSSFGELEYACKDYNAKSDENKPIYYPWDPNDASITTYPITTYQPKYFVAENLAGLIIHYFAHINIYTTFYRC